MRFSFNVIPFLKDIAENVTIRCLPTRLRIQTDLCKVQQILRKILVFQKVQVRHL
jgi:hypothetical protein